MYTHAGMCALLIAIEQQVASDAGMEARQRGRDLEQQHTLTDRPSIKSFNRLFTSWASIVSNTWSSGFLPAVERVSCVNIQQGLLAI